MRFGKIMKEYRNKNGFTQDQLAEKIHVSRQTISNWENGHCYPDVESLILLSRLYNISVDELIKRDVSNLDQKRLKRNIYINAVGMFVSITFCILFIGLSKYFEKYFLLSILYAFGAFLYFSIKAEKLKKEAQISTYKEIEAYMDHIFETDK